MMIFSLIILAIVLLAIKATLEFWTFRKIK